MAITIDNQEKEINEWLLAQMRPNVDYELSEDTEALLAWAKDDDNQWDLTTTHMMKNWKLSEAAATYLFYTYIYTFYDESDFYGWPIVGPVLNDTREPVLWCIQNDNSRLALNDIFRVIGFMPDNSKTGEGYKYMTDDDIDFSKFYSQ